MNGYLIFPNVSQFLISKHVFLQQLCEIEPPDPLDPFQGLARVLHCSPHELPSGVQPLRRASCSRVQLA